MRVLAVTNMWPSADRPRVGTFVERQVCGLKKIGTEIEPLIIDRRSHGAFTYRHVPTLVRRAVERFQPDVVHVMYGGVMAEAVFRSGLDVPVVQAFCGTDLLGEEVGSPIQRFRGWVGVVCSNRVAAKAQAIVVKSKNLERALPSRVESSRVFVIPNGIDLDLFSPLDRQACRARLGWRDGIFHVVFSTPRHSDANKRLGLAKGAIDFLNSGGLPAELHVMLEVPHSEVPMWLNAADSVLMTSHHEGSPNIIKEALACNRPVVSVDVGDVRERIQGIEGCFIAEPDAEDLAQKLKIVASGPGSVASREKMQALSIEAIARRLAMVYEAVTNPGERS